MSYKLVIKDAFWQIVWRIISAFAGFFVISQISPYFWPLRYWDYETILAYFAFASSLSDLWLYVLWLKQLWDKTKNNSDKEEINKYYSKIVFSRLLLIAIVYTIALVIAYLLPAYTKNVFLIYWLPLWMIFSATSMWAWILQLPLQIKRKMEQVSFSLIFARISQIVFLAIVIFIIFPKKNFPDWNISLQAFLTVLFSLVLSAWVQFLYTYIKGKKYFQLKKVKFLKFTIQTVQQNWKYWIGFFMSSAPVLAVTLILSWLYPTSSWYDYAWTRALAIKIITLLLVIPPAIWNSLLHKITWSKIEKQKKTFQTFFTLTFWIGSIILINSILFANWFIKIIWWEHYLSNINWQIVWNELISKIWVLIHNFLINQQWIGSDLLLIFLSGILIINFIKQVLNYYLLATSRQNYLFKINLIGIIIWFVVWMFMIQKYSLIWWLITQFTFEFVFTLWLFIVIYLEKIAFKLPIKDISKMILYYIIVFVMRKHFQIYNYIDNIYKFVIIWWIFNLFTLILRFKSFKKQAKQIL